MDLGEAEKSFDYFADLLKLQSALLNAAVDLEAKSASTEMAPQASEGRNQLLIDLKETRKKSQIISILLYQEMAKQAERLVSIPMELAKVHSASTRLKQAGQLADSLIEQQEKKQAENSKPKESASGRAIREFLEKHEREEAAARAERKRERGDSEPHR